MGRLHLALFFILLPILVPVLPGTQGADGEFRLDQLLSDDRGVREACVAHLRSQLTPNMAESLLGRFESLSPARRGALIGLLAKGGPWMPGVVRALGRDEGLKSPVGRILNTALLNRPRSDDPLPLLDELQIFGEGVGLRPRGTWPGAVGLGEFLDRINFDANPSHHFVLDPCLADRKIAPLEEAPPPGPAPMVIDFVLGERGLGVRRLETVLLVTEGGRSCHGLSAHDEEYDQILVDRIVDTLSARPLSAAARRSAFAALAALGIPGFFDGFFGELKKSAHGVRGEGADCFDYLLTAATLRRCARGIDVDGDASRAAAFVRALDETDSMARKRSLIRLVRILPEDSRGRALSAIESPSALLSALCESDWTDAERLAFVTGHLRSAESPARRAALHAALGQLHRSDALCGVLLREVPQWDRADPATGALLDRCVAAMGARCGDDGLARLIRRQGAGNQGAVEAASICGGSSCLAALIERLAKAEGRTLSTIESIRSICKRLELDPFDSVSSLESPLRPVVAAGLELACGTGRSARRSATALLVDEIITGGPCRDEAVELLSLAEVESIGADLAPLLDAVSDGRIEWPRPLGAAIVGSALRASRDNSMAAATLRYSLKNHPRWTIDPLLDRALKNLSAATKIGSFTIDLRID